MLLYQLKWQSACNIRQQNSEKLCNLRSPFKIPFYLVPPIVFSFRAKAFFYLGTIHRFLWNGTTVSHWRFHDNRRMNTSADVSSMNRLNQTEPATFSIVLYWTFFRDSVFLYLTIFPNHPWIVLFSNEYCIPLVTFKQPPPLNVTLEHRLTPPLLIPW
jgi:hypothetical protein